MSRKPSSLTLAASKSAHLASSSGAVAAAAAGAYGAAGESQPLLPPAAVSRGNSGRRSHRASLDEKDTGAVMRRPAGHGGSHSGGSQRSSAHLALDIASRLQTLKDQDTDNDDRRERYNCCGYQLTRRKFLEVSACLFTLSFGIFMLISSTAAFVLAVVDPSNEANMEF